MTRLSWTGAVVLALLMSAYVGASVNNRLGGSTSLFAHSTSTVSVTTSAIASSALVLPALPAETNTVPKEKATASTASTTAEKVPPVKPAQGAPSVSKNQTPPVSITSTATQLAMVDARGLNAAAVALRGALVNIVCYAPAGSLLHSISGSGIFIDQKGIILTNAHVAQYFLLHDRGVSCVIRAGSPAAPAYRAQLIYISPTWINANATVLTQTQPIGTGENDFAFLAITESESSTPLPAFFPFIPLGTTAPKADDPVAIASFGAQFLKASQIQTALFPTVVFGSVKQAFTFATSTIDVIDLGGSAAAQEGSSGGGVANAHGELEATITTSTIEGATATRTLSAITETYIRRAYETETHKTLSTLIGQPTSVSIADFAPKISALEAIITAQLAK